jgi:heme A synthase
MDLALTHQAVAIIVLTFSVLQAERLTRVRHEPIVQGAGHPATLAR